MNAFYSRPTAPSASLQPTANLLRRKPTRATVTLGWKLHQDLQARADEEGRSLSNLMAHLLETALAK
jgi:hypothetical protein